MASRPRRDANVASGNRNLVPQPAGQRRLLEVGPDVHPVPEGQLAGSLLRGGPDRDDRRHPQSGLCSQVHHQLQLRGGAAAQVRSVVSDIFHFAYINIRTRNLYTCIKIQVEIQ